MPNYDQQRKNLVELIRHHGISDTLVLNAIEKVPRHLFIPEAYRDEAYENYPVPIGEEQTISQPYTVAFMSELLEIEPGDKVLEIGTGSGYQAAILAEMGAKVFTIERIKKLFERTSKLLKDLGYEDKIFTFYGDGTLGLPDFAPFDKIIITAATPQVPEALKKQLKTGGYLVAPVGHSFAGSQKMVRLVKKADNDFETQFFGDFVFVPLKKGTE